MSRTSTITKTISILLALTFLCGQVYAGALSNLSSRNSDKLAASLATDSNINPTRSKPLQNDIAGKVEPGAIGNGMPLIELAGGKLPAKVILPDEANEVLNEAIKLAIKLSVDNQKNVPATHQKRFKQALDNLIDLQNKLASRAYLFYADVRSPEDYLLGFSHRKNVGLSLELIYELDSISPKRLAQYVFHECVPEKGIITERDDHRIVYNEIQSAIFGQDEVLALKKDLREFIDGKAIDLTQFEAILNDKVNVHALIDEIEAAQINDRKLRLSGTDKSTNAGMKYGTESVVEYLRNSFNLDKENPIREVSIKDLIITAVTQLAYIGSGDASDTLLYLMKNPHYSRAIIFYLVSLGSQEDFVDSTIYRERTNKDDYQIRMELAIAKLVSKIVRFEPQRKEGIPFAIKIAAKRMSIDNYRHLVYEWTELLSLLDRIAPRELIEALYNRLSRYATPEVCTLPITLFLETDYFHAVKNLKAWFGQSGDEPLGVFGISNTASLPVHFRYLEEVVPDYRIAMLAADAICKIFHQNKLTLNKEQFLIILKSAQQNNSEFLISALGLLTPKNFRVPKEAEALIQSLSPSLWKKLSERLEYLKKKRLLRELTIMRKNRLETGSVSTSAENKLRSNLQGKNRRNPASGEQISEDLPVRAKIFAANLTKILAEHQDQLFFMGIETGIGDAQKAQIMPVYKAIDEIQNLKDANGNPLFPNLMVKRATAGELELMVRDLNKDGKLNLNNAFIGARKVSVDNKAYDAIKGEGMAWIAAIDDSIPGDYLPVFEAITLNMMAYLNADMAAIKNFYDAISDKPIDPGILKDMIRNRIIYILPRATKFDTKQLRELYELAQQVYVAA